MKGNTPVSDAADVAHRTKDWGYIPPTSNADVRFVYTTRGSRAESAEPDPTSDAGVEFSYHDVDRKLRSNVKVPGKFTAHLLDTLDVTIGVVGMVAAPVAILKFTSGALPSELLFALCLAAVVAVGGLTRSVIKRRR
ncbi:hypothetical protein GA0070558_1775 [Micromonospora haikouensis]|uniref:Uncharacterized protein n=1 Tax=Micromonospora haikouensis TaxID=686309 RepID=A0A1C4YSU6_9ACTN|nr:hypothetical protein GA0070558_1775 [Micromonospora haikouensis]